MPVSEEFTKEKNLKLFSFLELFHPVIVFIRMCFDILHKSLFLILSAGKRSYVDLSIFIPIRRDGCYKY